MSSCPILAIQFSCQELCSMHSYSSFCWMPCMKYCDMRGNEGRIVYMLETHTHKKLASICRLFRNEHDVRPTGA